MTVAESSPETASLGTVMKASSYREESNFLSDLKDHESRALLELKLKLEESILLKTLYDGPESDPDAGASIWGVPLLPSKGNDSTDVVLLKFLRARDFRVNDAFNMMKKTLKWRKDFEVDSILNKEFCPDLAAASYISGADRDGRPVCYNIFRAFSGDEEKTVATEEFWKWRVQLMEKGALKLDMKPGGVNSLVQVHDLKNSVPPFKKEVRVAVNKFIRLLQDNYPEFVAKNVFINVPLWYKAFYSLVSLFLSHRSRSKLVLARPFRVTETLLKYISIEEIPAQYGGFKRENEEEEFEFAEIKEVTAKAGSVETIEIPTPETGTKSIWDIVVVGWDVVYTEEFVPCPDSSSSYTMIIQKERKIGFDEGSIRNTFHNAQPGKIVITVNNYGKKKTILYRSKVISSE